MYWELFILITVAISFTKGLFDINRMHESIAIEETYGKNITLEVDVNKEFVIRFPDSHSKNPYTIYVWSVETFYDYPVFIVVRQQADILSWELPLPVESHSGTFKFIDISRTLCHSNMDIIAELPRNITHNSEFNRAAIPSLHKHLTVSVSTASERKTTVLVNVEEEDNFYIIENKNYTAMVSPSEPKFFYYKFLDDTEDDVNAIIVEIASADNVCLTVSIQNATCPVSDLNHNEMFFNGKRQTVETKGGIIIKRREFPNGFFLVLVAKGDNYECGGGTSTIPHLEDDEVIQMNRSSTVSFIIHATISYDDYLIAALSTFGVIAIFYVIFILIMCGCYRYVKVFRKSDNPTDQDVNLNGFHSENSLERLPDQIDSRLGAIKLKLSDLAMYDSDHYEKKSSNYLWHVISIAIFYGIPVIQLVISYQRVVNISGNQDICYYNFLCALPLIGLSDFNHVFSNIGYALAGILFLIITFYRNRRVVCRDKYGIPKHYGLFYAMGVSLIMEGILSACYHVCPNQTNFQFDTSFMYIMATLCLVKLYQNRHPDINATAYATFMVLGFAIFAAMVGVLNGHIVLWILFIIVYILLCFYVSFNVYFLSYIKEGLLSVVHELNEEHNVFNAISPKRRAHFVLLLILNIINVCLAGYGIVCYLYETDFATYLLSLLMGNAILYATIYIIMKTVHREKICVHTALCGIIAIVAWAAACYFFVNNSTEWRVTPAESRKFNTHCVLLNFYDYHDVWHLLSALALFFTFMLLLTLDDDLINVHHSKISVF